MTRAESYLLAGYVAGFPWAPPPGPYGIAALPPTVATVSECLTDFLPSGQDLEPWQQQLFEPWHRSLRQAADAARRAPAGQPTVHVLSVSLTAATATRLTAMVQDWIGDPPRPILVNLAQPTAAAPGTIQGFEVLGFEAGKFHSWLCYRLDTPALRELGIRPGNAGLLATADEAQRIADMANNDGGTPEEITWFPVRITEHDIHSAGTVVPGQ
ncbi:hypothetical protein [Actinoplanes flavus]|uniref:Uncharacterized protein n=1 Tax=Actinoplanes flavus TaxID=2820290 RepID=A0ABS3UT62_9ACTN|nr:hypothetical protein [Actinoplanes flavus]MBO3741765.1 hypothetical protein [Actinoplanes flavus]